MEVRNYLAYRVVPVEQARQLTEGDIIPIPQKDDSLVCSPKKKTAEDLFESVRESYNPYLPSRLSVLFVLPYKEERVQYWLFSHYSHTDFDYGLLTLKLTGELCWCDESLFTASFFPKPEPPEEKALNYWKSAGNNYAEFTIPEGLFSGIATIISVEFKVHKGIH